MPSNRLGSNVVRRIVIVLAAVGLALGWALGAPAARAAEYVRTEEYIESADGVRLHAFVYRPTAASPVPVILTVTPYAGTGGNFVDFATNPSEVPLVGSATPGPGGLGERLLERGYAVVVVSLRGYGGSGGCLDFGGLGEQADVAASIAWSASQSWSDGAVGMIGHSYPGQTGLMGLASREPGLRAVVAGAPPAGYHNLYTNGVANLPSAHFYPGVYALSDLFPPSLQSPSEQHSTSLGGTATNPTCPATEATSFDSDQSSDYWVERDLVPKLAGTTVPTLLTQGFNDYQVRPNAITDIWGALAGPRRLVLGPYDHGIHPVDDSRDSEVLAWFDRYVGAPNRPAGGGRHPNGTPDVRIQSVGGDWRAESEWPPTAVVPRRLPILPGIYTDVAGNDGETGPPALWPFDPPMQQGTGSWTFTPSLATPVHLTGVPRLTVELDALLPDVHVIALVYDVDESGQAQLVTRGAALAGAAGDGFDLYPLDWRFPTGHRIGILLTGADDLWFEPSNTGTPVTIVGGALDVSELTEAGPALASGPFRARTQHPPFPIEDTVIEERTTA